MSDKVCPGENCTSTDGTHHSPECLFEHFASYTGLHTEEPHVQEKIKRAYMDGYEAGAEPLPRFPTMLRKMWSGSEVQAWIDEVQKGVSR